MSSPRPGDSERFARILGRLAESPDGWASEAGENFALFMREVMTPKSEAMRALHRGAEMLVDPDDVVSEAIFVVQGPSSTSLAVNARRILEMQRPLGYVIAAVSANISRSMLAGRMGVGSRQVTAETSAVVRCEQLSGELRDSPRDRIATSPVWASGEGQASREARLIVGSSVAVLGQRFGVDGEAARRGLEVAGTAALEGDGGAGMTPATARRRRGMFMKQLPALRGAMNEGQAQAFSALLFGSERHPEWSLLAECARAVRERDAVKVSAWQAAKARAVASPGRAVREMGRQPALFALPEPAGERVRHRMTA